MYVHVLVLEVLPVILFLRKKNIYKNVQSFYISLNYLSIERKSGHLHI